MQRRQSGDLTNCRDSLLFIGVSLSKPHTSVTALCTRVCIIVTTYQKSQTSAFEYFSKYAMLSTQLSRGEALMPDCSVSA